MLKPVYLKTVYLITEVNKITGLREPIGILDGSVDFECLKQYQIKHRASMLGIEGFSLNVFKNEMPRGSTTLTFKEQFKIESIEEFLERLQKHES